MPRRRRATSEGTISSEEDLVPPRFEIRFAGRPDLAAGKVFAGLDLVSDGKLTVVSGEFDQAALHGLLERVRALGLDLVEVRRVRGQHGR
jgi:hypothetical protein